MNDLKLATDFIFSTGVTLFNWMQGNIICSIILLILFLPVFFAVFRAVLS